MTEEIEPGLENWRVRAETAEAALLSAQAETELRLIRAELKAEAIRAGMVDLDGLKLLDTTDVRLNNNGEVADAAAILAKLKVSKTVVIWKCFVIFGRGKSAAAGTTADTPCQRT